MSHMICIEIIFIEIFVFNDIKILKKIIYMKKKVIRLSKYFENIL